MYALTKIAGVGRRYSNIVCKKADGALPATAHPPLEKSSGLDVD